MRTDHARAPILRAKRAECAAINVLEGAACATVEVMCARHARMQALQYTFIHNSIIGSGATFPHF